MVVFFFCFQNMVISERILMKFSGDDDNGKRNSDFILMVIWISGCRNYLKIFYMPP